MKSSRIYLHFLQDIHDNIGKALQFVDGLDEEAFLQDEKTSFAVVRALEIIGEAAKNIPKDIQIKYSQVPWREMSRMRDKLIHHYFGVNLSTVWKTVQEDLLSLYPEIADILREEKRSS